MPVQAQINRFESNTSLATSGLFGNDTDDFLNVNNWQDVEFNHFFSTVALDSISGLGAGLALRTGALYLGFGYMGDIWEGALGKTTTEYGKDHATVDRQGKKLVTRSPSSSLTWNNQLSALIGHNSFGGIMLDFNMAGFGRNNRDNDIFDASGNVLTNEESVGTGALEFGAMWGKNFELQNGLTLKPSVGFWYNTNMEKTVTKPAGGVETTTLTGVDSFFSRTDLGLLELNGGRVGLTGGFNVYAGLEAVRYWGSTEGSVWLSYNLDLRTYDKQTESGSSYTDYSPSFHSHLINLGVGATYALDRRLSFAWAFGLGVGITNADITSAQDETPLAPNHEFSLTLLELFPKLSGGVVYRVMPERFNLNASLALMPADFSLLQLDHTDQTTARSIKTTSTRIDNAHSLTSLGFTWFVIDNLTFDAALNAAVAARVDVTAFSMLVSYKR
jgi:hypothetical protein